MDPTYLIHATYAWRVFFLLLARNRNLQVRVIASILNAFLVDAVGYNFVLQGLNGANGHKQVLEKQTKELLLTFHCFCSRKDVSFRLSSSSSSSFLSSRTKVIFFFLPENLRCLFGQIHCFDVVLEDTDIAKAITEYVAHAAIENLVLGASRHGFIK